MNTINQCRDDRAATMQRLLGEAEPLDTAVSLVDPNDVRRHPDRYVGTHRRIEQFTAEAQRFTDEATRDTVRDDAILAKLGALISKWETEAAKTPPPPKPPTVSGRHYVV